MTAPEMVFEVAAIERKMPGKDIVQGTFRGWAWNELNIVDERVGGAPRAQRDALKLLAVLIQHTDSKPEQQRLSCLDGSDELDGTNEDEAAHSAAKTRRAKPVGQASDERHESQRDRCRHPFMLLNDLGLTFARANTFNMGPLSGVNFDRWSTAPVWKDRVGCVGFLPKSTTGTLENPTISEEGRQFVADLLVQLTDQQLYDLFDVARFELRSHDPDRDPSGPTVPVEKWVKSFKQKRDEIVNRHCG